MVLTQGCEHRVSGRVHSRSWGSKRNLMDPAGGPCSGTTGSPSGGMVRRVPPAAFGYLAVAITGIGGNPSLRHSRPAPVLLEWIAF